jgi:hypothetical protein
MGSGPRLYPGLGYTSKRSTEGLGQLKFPCPTNVIPHIESRIAEVPAVTYARQNNARGPVTATGLLLESCFCNIIRTSKMRDEAPDFGRPSVGALSYARLPRVERSLFACLSTFGNENKPLRFYGLGYVKFPGHLVACLQVSLVCEPDSLHVCLRQRSTYSSCRLCFQ